MYVNFNINKSIIRIFCLPWQHTITLSITCCSCAHLNTYVHESPQKYFKKGAKPPPPTKIYKFYDASEAHSNKMGRIASAEGESQNFRLFVGAWHRKLSFSNSGQGGKCPIPAGAHTYVLVRNDNSKNPKHIATILFSF